MKGVLGVVAVILAAVLIIFFIKGCGGGFGPGTDGDSSSSSDDKQTEITSEEVTSEIVTTTEDSNEVVIKITEDKVTVNDKEIADKDELKSYIESVNSDSKEYKLIQENAILSTYNWVTEVFDDLQIPLQETK